MDASEPLVGLVGRRISRVGVADDGLYRWQHASTRIVDETAYPRQRCQVQLHGVHRCSAPSRCSAAAPRCGSCTARTTCQDGSVASNARAHSRPKPELAPVTIAARVESVISPPEESA